MRSCSSWPRSPASPSTRPSHEAYPLPCGPAAVGWRGGHVARVGSRAPGPRAAPARGRRMRAVQRRWQRLSRAHRLGGEARGRCPGLVGRPGGQRIAVAHHPGPGHRPRREDGPDPAEGDRAGRRRLHPGAGRAHGSEAGCRTHRKTHGPLAQRDRVGLRTIRPCPRAGTHATGCIGPCRHEASRTTR